jgi:hypothetical protein
MRIAWRWVLPVVPLLLLFSAGYEDYSRDRSNVHMQRLRAKYGENFSCLHLWASREAYEDDKKNGWGAAADCFPKPLARYATLSNIPGIISGWFGSIFLLKRFNLPMAPAFYAFAFATSFGFWYSLGSSIERRRKARAKARLSSQTDSPA